MCGFAELHRADTGRRVLVHPDAVLVVWEGYGPEPCPACGGCGIGGSETVWASVTREMALDADDPSLEGSPVACGEQPTPCAECHGRGDIPARPLLVLRDGTRTALAESYARTQELLEAAAGAAREAAA